MTIIEAHNLTRIYPMGPNNVIGLNRVDLAVTAGELIVLKGHSGSGKSTLLALLAGLDRPTRGRLIVAQSDLLRCTAAQLTRFRREVVGMIFQTFNLLPTLNVIENICLPGLLAGKPYAAMRANADELAGWLNLKQRRSHLPSQLSGGEMQRTAIARALINDPEIILADEPTGNLDSNNGQMIIDLLADLNRRLQRTVIIATHSNLADRVATRQVVLKDGAIASAQ
jgi:ABC-type lipoprotein export system ATPase subunit